MKIKVTIISKMKIDNLNKIINDLNEIKFIKICLILACWVISSWGFCVGIKRKFINLVNLPSIKSVAFLSPF